VTAIPAPCPTTERTARLARVATAGPDGQPDVVPVGFEFEFDGTCSYIGGIDKVALVIDNIAVADPWTPRLLRVYGTAELVERDTPFGRQPIMKLTPALS